MDQPLGSADRPDATPDAAADAQADAGSGPDDGAATEAEAEAAGRLMARLQAAAHRNAFLAELAAATQPLDEPAVVMQTAARMLAEHLDCDRCAYAEVEDQAVFVITGDHAVTVPSIVGRWPVAAFGPHCVRSMHEGRAFVVPDSQDDPQVGPDDLPAYRATDIRAVVCVPLHKAGHFIAAMAVHQARPRRWTADEVELVQLVTSRCWEALERSRVTRTLQGSEARMRAMVEATPECVKLLDAQGRLLQINAAGLRMIEVATEAEATGLCYYDLVAPQDRERFRAFNEQVCRGQPGQLGFGIAGRAGTLRWVESNAVPLPAPEGGFHQLAVTRDVTERIKADRALADSRQRLADLNERLREQDRRKDEFLATLAHELRNPLAPIRTGLAVLRQGGDLQRSEQVRDMMERQLTHLVRMVDDLLDISRITLDKVTLKKQPLDFHAALQSGLEAARPQVEAGDHALEVEVPPHPLPMEADPTRIAQVIANLVNNAAKYTPRGGRIRLKVLLEPGQPGLPEQLLLQVCDSGLGISADMLPRVFDLFTQGEAVLPTAPAGLGLGLALVRRLVEMHGGSVQAHSAGPGRGSRFVVRLPLLPQPSAGGATAAVHAPALPAAAPAFGPLRVLIVDDNVDAAETLAMLLELEGHAVSLEHSGEAGLQAAAAQRPDVLLLDIGLPGIDGYEVARRLRADALLRPQPRIVALTGWGTDDDRRKARAAGMDAHLVKPVDAQALGAALRPLVTE